MAKSVNDIEKQANKDIGIVINYFYTRLGIKPDATHFKSAYNMLKPLIFPDEMYHTYNSQEIKAAIDILVDNNIFLASLSILSWPNFISSVVRKDNQSIRIIIKSMKDAQLKDGIIPNDAPPKGW